MSLKKLFALLVIVWCSGMSVAQYNFYERNYLEPEADTVLFDKRSGTRHIDSLDRAYYNYQPSLFNNGRAYLPEFRDVKDWGTYRHLFADERPFYKADYHFTALPYVGFFYSFGGGGDQVLDLRYTHNFGNRVNLSFRYHRSADNGQMRNMSVNNNDLSLKLSYRGNHFRSYLDAYYGYDKYSESGGVTASQNLEPFTIDLFQTRKNDARAKVQRAYITSKNFLVLGKDSLSPWNVYFSPSWYVYERRYEETLSDTALINNANYSSTYTSDNWQEPHLLLDAGILFNKGKFRFSAGYTYDYWVYSNHANRIASSDNYLVSGLKWDFGKFRLDNDFRFFITGNPFEFSDKAKLTFAWNEKNRVGAEFLIENYFLEPFQMRYSANHFDWSNAYTNSTSTKRIFGNVFYEFSGKQKVRVNIRQLVINNQYLFENGNWSATGTTQSVFTPSLSVSLRFWKFSSNTSAELFVSDKSVLQHPDYRIRSRFFFDSPVFKAKRLKIATGVEVNYIPNYRVASYIPELGLFYYSNAIQNNSINSLQLDFFLNFEIERFRFFVSANGLNNLWDNSPRFYAEGYPVRPFFLRLGLSWDFVN